MLSVETNHTSDRSEPKLFYGSMFGIEVSNLTTLVTLELVSVGVSIHMGTFMIFWKKIEKWLR